MSSLLYVNGTTPLFLPAYGLNQIYTNKLEDPPLGILDKGVIYELNDGVLYFNGSPISGIDGVTGPIGPTGPQGVTGPAGSNPNVFYNMNTKIDGTNQSITSGTNYTPIFSVTNDIFDLVPFDMTLTSFYYHLDRVLVPTESFFIRLFKNGGPLVSLGPLNDLSPQSGIVPVNESFVAGDQIFILINAWVPVGAEIITSMSLYGVYD